MECSPDSAVEWRGKRPTQVYELCDAYLKTWLTKQSGRAPQSRELVKRIDWEGLGHAGAGVGSSSLKRHTTRLEVDTRTSPAASWTVTAAPSQSNDGQCCVCSRAFDRGGEKNENKRPGTEILVVQTKSHICVICSSVTYSNHTHFCPAQSEQNNLD